MFRFTTQKVASTAKIFRDINYLLKNNALARENISFQYRRNIYNVFGESANWTTKVKQHFHSYGKFVLFVFAGVYAVKSTVKSSSCEKIERKSKILGQKTTLEEAVDKGRDLAQRIKDETGCPGLVIAVSCDGKQVWAEGMGYADIENRVPCLPETVMRIASISKTITMTEVARLWETGKLDLDAPVQKYVPDFPEKMVDGQKVTITTRHLVSHLSGIRHYEKDYMKKKTSDKKDKKSSEKADESKEDKELQPTEMYIKDYFKNIADSLKLFKDDSLVHKPGSKYLYTTHGWTLVSAVVEAAAKKPFRQVMENLFKELGMQNTCFELSDVLIYNRARYYVKDKNGHIKNAPYVDNSYKWAGGGFLSTVEDLVKFGNIMLYSFQQTPEGAAKSEPEPDRRELKSNSRKKTEVETGETVESTEPKPSLPGFLKSETVRSLWAPVDKTECFWDKTAKYGMGWAIVPEKHEHGECEHQRYYVTHTGAAVGASSVLLVLPRDNDADDVDEKRPPRGVVVAIIVNMVSISLGKTAMKVAKVFEELDVSEL